MPVGARVRGALLVGLTSFLLSLPGCGEPTPSSPDDPAAGGPVTRGRTHPSVTIEPVSDADKARFALDRLFHGPLSRTQRFPIPSLHSATLEMALLDLQTLETETLALLADEAVVHRATTAPSEARNPWHTVLELLSRLEAPSEPVVLAWTRPALEAGDVALMRRAVKALATLPRSGDAVGELLLDFLAAKPADRDVAPIALRVLLARGHPFSGRALDLLYREGSGRAWTLVPEAIASTEGPDDALAWFALLAEVSGPQPKAFTSRSLEPLWQLVPYMVREDVWPVRMEGLDVARRHDRLLGPAWLEDALGSIPVSPSASPLVPLAALEMDGTLPAASARCRLAAKRAGGVAEASVRGELGGADPALDVIARRCATTQDETPELDPAETLHALLQQLKAGLVPDASLGAAALGALRSRSEKAEAVSLALEALTWARPQEVYQTLLFAAQDTLDELDPQGLETFLDTSSASEDPSEVELALILMRRQPRAAYGDLIEARLAEAEGGEFQDPLRRLLVWVMSRAPDMTEARREAFIPTLAGWIEQTPEPWASVLAPALLDLGASGHEAFAAGLRGARRTSYLRAVGRVRRVLQLPVAEALLDVVDDATPAEERHAVWAAVFRTAPATATGALEAARRRLDPADRDEARDVFEVVRHRAAKPAP